MLRERTAKAIAILHQAGGRTASSDTTPVRCIDPSERMQLESLLTSSGLLDPAGRLLRPLDSISLYEVLSIVDEGIYPLRKDDDFNELPRRTSAYVCKHGMYRTMIRELLLRMKVSEF